MENDNSKISEGKRVPLILVGFLAILVPVFIFGLKWVFSLGGGEIGSVPFLFFDYAVGLTMIFLPCTLPLAFVIVPLVMGKSYGKGLGMALAFGLGVVVTLSFYGALIGLFGQALGVDKVETAKNILYALAGALAIAFALGELNLIKFRAPSYGGAVPGFIMRQKDILKAGMLGLFLGNVGVGCPNPLFNAVIIPYIVTTASVFQGWLIMVVQALGRLTPLFILAFLAILGVNATKFLVRHKDTVSHFTAWTTVFIGGFLLTLGLFGHDGWVLTGTHTVTEFLTQESFITNLLGGKVGEMGHGHGMPSGKGLFGLPIEWATPFLVLSWILPMVWYWRYRRKNISKFPAEKQAEEQKTVTLLGLFFAALALFLITLFGYFIPHMYLAHWSTMTGEHELESADFHIALSAVPSLPEPGQQFELDIALHDKKGRPISDLKISHERILHVILASEDLEEFLHLHPEDFPEIKQNPEEGQFQISLTLSKSGRYRVLVDAFRSGTGEVAGAGWIRVGSQSEPIAIDKDLSREKTFEGYRVFLQTDPQELKAGQEVHLQYFIEKDGKPVTDNETYLGADMHLAIFSVDLAVAFHTHGLKEKSGAIDAHQVFPHQGLWKIYGQFQHQGRVITADFMVEVFSGGGNAGVILQQHQDQHD